MSIGIRMHDLQKGTLGQRAHYAKAQGFECVHLALSKVIDPAWMAPSAATPGMAAYIRKELDGLEMAVLGCYLNLADPREDAYQQAVAKYVAHLRLSRWLNAGVVGTETGNPNEEYRYDPQTSHSEESLSLFIDRLRPVVDAAEKLGAILAIEPVYTHIVSDPKRARRVLDAIASPNLQIILDAVNLLHADNVDRAASVIDEAIELLGDDVAVLHMKDYVIKDGAVRACAVSTGVMDYTALLKFANRKPHIDMTLEDTVPDNAQAAGDYLRARLEWA